LSLKPKSEWDIAGGMALLSAQNMVLRDQFNRPISMNKKDVRSRGLIVGRDTIISDYIHYCSVNRLQSF